MVNARMQSRETLLMTNAQQHHTHIHGLFRITLVSW